MAIGHSDDRTDRRTKKESSNEPGRTRWFNNQYATTVVFWIRNVIFGGFSFVVTNEHPNGRTDIQTDGRTDTHFCRYATT